MDMLSEKNAESHFRLIAKCAEGHDCPMNSGLVKSTICYVLILMIVSECKILKKKNKNNNPHTKFDRGLSSVVFYLIQNLISSSGMKINNS
jgi:hypothetical protein